VEERTGELQETNERLNVEVESRKRSQQELESMQQRLMETSRQAGMAEVATGVLHNVGNVLNSVNVSATVIQDRMLKSKLSSLINTADLLRAHADGLAAFLSEDPRGKLVPGFIVKLASYLAAEQEETIKELSVLARNIEHIKEIVIMQQSYAKMSGVAEILSPAQLVEDALRMNEAALARHSVKVVREFAEVPPVSIDKHKALQILVNLIRNAKYALDHSTMDEKQLTIRVKAPGPDKVSIVIQDNGVGIPEENLVRIFQHGFTTKRDGHGFGLHSGALAAKEMGGNLSVHSDGIGKGAQFTLELPISRTIQAAA
jgi:C4-dicarboxylate-specific signal transduction histidine kinase